jgi:undecaprenyl pyrophosphate phosphatase UppP
MQLWEPFVTWQFLVACVAIVAVVSTLKKAVHQAAPALSNKGYFKAFLTMANLLVGTLVAAPTGFLVGETFVERMLVGLCAGLLSNFVYAALIKRLTVALATEKTDA